LNETLPIPCPYCNETLYIEPEPADQVIEYVEDCHVCCRPILIKVEYSEDGSRITAEKENQ
jgi:hypothetical protein